MNSVVQELAMAPKYKKLELILQCSLMVVQFLSIFSLCKSSTLWQGNFENSGVC